MPQYKCITKPVTHTFKVSNKKFFPNSNSSNMLASHVQVLCASNKKTAIGMVAGLKAAISVAGPSIGFVIQVNVCVLFTVLFFVGTWLAFLATTFGVFLAAAFIASRQVLALGLATSLLFGLTLTFALKSSALRTIYVKIVRVLSRLEVASNQKAWYY